MAKKRKKGGKKGKETIPFIVFTPEAAPQHDDVSQEMMARVEAFVHAEPGWQAVFAACVTCETPSTALPVVFWALVRWENGVSDVCGLVHGLDGFFFYPQNDHTFIGYVGPGQEPEQLISRLFDSHEE